MSDKWILCMLSGGLDSTGALYKIVTEDEYKDYHIHVHSMTINNFEERAPAEYKAVNDIRKWFEKNYPDRPLVFDRSIHDYTYMGNNFIWDADLTAYMGAQIIRHSDREYVGRVVGRTLTDHETSILHFDDRLRRALNIYAVTFGDCGKNQPETLIPVGKMRKRDIWDMLPHDLRELTWSCRKPKRTGKNEYAPCGRCITCRDIREMFND